MGNEVSKINNTSDSAEEAVSRLIGTLKRVEAPKDFEFRVKARIAKGSPAEKRASWLPASVRYAVPLGLMLAVGGYLGLKAVYTPDVTSVPAVAQTDVRPAPVAMEPSVITAPVAKVDEQTSKPSAPVKDEVAAVSSNVVKDPVKRVTPTVKTTERGGGSGDAGSGITKVIPSIGPKANADSQPASNQAFLTPNLSSGEILVKLGIKTSSGGKVESVNGSAAAAGVRAGDVIVSVNGQGKSLTVRRNGVTTLIAIGH